MPLAATRAEYQFVLELYRDTSDGDSEQIATARVKPDWDPIHECARFECAKQLLDAELRLGAEKVAIEPLWSEQLGEPYLHALRAVAVSENGHEAACEIPTAWFQTLAEKASAKVIAQGKLLEEEAFRYLVTAYPKETAPTKAPAFAIESIAQRIVLRRRALSDYVRNSRPCGPIDETALPVFIPESILDEGQAALEEAGAAETGGILIGHVNHDPESNTLFLEVTAQIQAKHTQADLTSLTFTPETWSDVDAALQLRGLNEMQLGWWHTHPARQWCKDCPVENRKVCKRSGEFFSSHDTALHRTVFPRAYSIALVISDSYNDGLTWPMFGWKQGMIQRRGFRVAKNE